MDAFLLKTGRFRGWTKFGSADYIIPKMKMKNELGNFFLVVVSLLFFLKVNADGTGDLKFQQKLRNWSEHQLKNIRTLGSARNGGVSLRKVTLPDNFVTKYSSRCLDGTNYAYYLRLSKNSTKWVFFLEGGGLCVEVCLPILYLIINQLINFVAD